MAISEDPPGSPSGPATDLIVNFTQTAQGLFRAGGVELTLQAVVDLAVATIEGCDFAGVFVLRAGNVTTPVKTDAVVAELDARQIGGKEGPCLDCIAQGPHLRRGPGRRSPMASLWAQRRRLRGAQRPGPVPDG